MGTLRSIASIALLLTLAFAAACSESEEQKAQRAAEMVTTAEKHHDFGEHDKAIELCTQALEISASLGSAHSVRSRAYLKKGMLTEAEADIARWIELDGGADALIAMAKFKNMMGDNKAALELVKKAREADPAEPKVMGWDAYFMCLNRQEKEAFELAKEAVRLDRYNLAGHMALGEYLLRRGELATAASEAAAAKAVDPSAEEPLILLGRTQLALESFVGAKSELVSATTNNPYSTRAWIALAVCNARAGNADDAQAALAKAEGLQAEAFAAQILVAKAEIAFAAGKNDEALKQIDAAAQKGSDDDRIWTILGTIRLMSQELAKGITELDAAIKKQSSAELLTQRGMLRLLSGNSKGAYDDARAAAKLEPKRAAVKLLQGHAAYSQNKFGEAANAYSYAASAAPGSMHARACYFLAWNKVKYDDLQEELKEGSRRSTELLDTMDEFELQVTTSQNPARDHYGLAALYAAALQIEDMRLEKKPARKPDEERKKALEHLKKAREAGYNNRLWWDFDPCLKELRGDPALKEIWP